MENKTLRIALTKGRLEKDTVGLFEDLGFDVSALRDKGRKLILPIPEQNIEVVLAKAGKKGEDFYAGYGVKTVASKYTNVARSFFESKGMDVDIVKIEGSVELAPLLGLADGIVDIVETGVTLKENGLEVYEDVAPISARLIVNTVSMKLKQQRIEQLVSLIENKLKERENA